MVSMVMRALLPTAVFIRSLMASRRDLLSLLAMTLALFSLLEVGRLGMVCVVKVRLCVDFPESCIVPCSSRDLSRLEPRNGLAISSMLIA